MQVRHMNSHTIITIKRLLLAHLRECKGHRCAIDDAERVLADQGLRLNIDVLSVLAVASGSERIVVVDNGATLAIEVVHA